MEHSSCCCTGMALSMGVRSVLTGGGNRHRGMSVLRGD